ncbi:MAG: STAS domain-containing protein [Ardenticatenaceae bacterium]|nr:STAS domain-containing protein [Ardenticatenaceae bacterium]
MPTTEALTSTSLSELLARHGHDILPVYVAAQQNTRASQLLSHEELQRQCATILDQLQQGRTYDPGAASYDPLRQTLASISRTRAAQGFTPAETATFVFSLKEVLLPYLEQALADDPQEFARQLLALNRLLDAFGLLTFETYVQGREALIREQSQAILELSTPVVQLWEDILVLPIIGSIDTARTQQIMENLLNRIVETGSSIVIVDITGVPVVDTAVAKHLLQTVSAARLVGAETVIVGISARVAQTLVHLGVELSEVITRTGLAKGLEYALERTGQMIVRIPNARERE